MADISKIIERLKTEEGFHKVSGRHVPYLDHKGNLTIGYGTLIEPRKQAGISDDAAEFLLSERILYNLQGLQDNIAFWDDLTENRQLALQDMAYQMGLRGILKFKRMLAAMEIGHWKRARLECLDSNYARRDTPKRAKRNAELILKG